MKLKSVKFNSFSPVQIRPFGDFTQESREVQIPFTFHATLTNKNEEIHVIHSTYLYIEINEFNKVSEISDAMSQGDGVGTTHFIGCNLTNSGYEDQCEYEEYLWECIHQSNKYNNEFNKFITHSQKEFGVILKELQEFQE